MEKNCGGERFGQEMRDMQTLASGKNERRNAKASARGVQASTSLDVPAAAIDVRAASAGDTEGNRGEAGMASEQAAHEPKGRMALILAAMRADDPTRVWTPREIGAVAGCEPGKVHSTTIRAMEYGLMHRLKNGKSVGYCLQIREGAQVPRTEPKRRERKPNGHWEPSPDEIRIPRVVPGWMPPKMVAPREVR